MPQLCGYTWSEELDALIRAEANAAGVPLDLAYTFIGAESSFNPDTYVNTALEESVGLLELNRRGGQGTGYTVAQLKDPATNLRIGLPYIRRAFEAVWRPGIPPREFIWQLSVQSGHPGPVAETDYRMDNIRRIWACFYPAVGASLGGPAISSAPTHAPAPSMAASTAEVLLLPILMPLAAAYVAFVTIDQSLAPLDSLRPLRGLSRPVFDTNRPDVDNPPLGRSHFRR